MVGSIAISTYFADGQLDTMERYKFENPASTKVVTSKWTYDGAGRIDALEHRNASNVLFAGYGYGWDAANRMESMDFLVSARDNEDVTFTHDDIGQLEGAQRSGTANDESYFYDDNGNRDLVSRSDGLNQDWTVTANNRLDSDGTFTYAYDDEGNMKSKTRINASVIVDDFRTEFTWDRRNRLTKVEIKRNGSEKVGSEKGSEKVSGIRKGSEKVSGTENAID